MTETIFVKVIKLYKQIWLVFTFFRCHLKLNVYDNASLDKSYYPDIFYSLCYIDISHTTFEFIEIVIYYFLKFSDLCLFLSKNTSKIDAFDCKTRFKHGCPDKPYRGSTIFKCKTLQISLEWIQFSKWIKMCLWFLSHLSWKLKLTFLIACRPSSYRPSVRLFINISHFQILHNHSANFNKIWHKKFLGIVDSSLFKWRDMAFAKGR